MRVALVVPGGVDPSGEFRVIPALLWLMERLARDVDLVVFALNQDGAPSRYALRGAQVQNLEVGRLWPRAVVDIIREHRRRRFDVIHAFWVAPSGTVAGLVGRVIRRPVVLHLAGGELVSLADIGYGSQLYWRGRLWVRLALRWATRTTAASDSMLAEARRFGVEGERVPLGVALDRWPASTPRRRAPGEARLIHVGSLNAVKDQEMLLEAAALLADRDQGFTLDVVGEDTLGGALQSRARALGLSDRVRFHGFLPHERLRPLLEAADVFVLSSRHEAGPVAVLEAAVVGVPTVGTDVGHVRELAPEAAVAVPVGDAEALARGVESLLADEDRRLRLAREARRRALEWDADRTAHRVREIYEEVRGVAARKEGARL